MAKPKSKKRRARSDSQAFGLWQIGLVLIVAGPVAHLILESVWPLTPPLTNEQRGQAFGRGLVTIVAVITGVVMLGLHLVRRK